MTVVSVGEIELDYERSGNAGGPPLLLIMGMSGTALHWGEPFLELLREDFDVIAYDHRGVGASSELDGQLTIAPDGRRRCRAAGVARARLGTRAGDLDGRHDRSGARAASIAARIRTLTLGCTYCGGPGSALADRQGAATALRGDGLGRRRTRTARRLGDQRLARNGRRRAGVGGVPCDSACVAPSPCP